MVQLTQPHLKVTVAYVLMLHLPEGSVYYIVSLCINTFRYSWKTAVSSGLTRLGRITVTGCVWWVQPPVEMTRTAWLFRLAWISSTWQVGLSRSGNHSECGMLHTMLKNLAAHWNLMAKQEVSFCFRLEINRTLFEKMHRHLNAVLL